MERKNLNLTIIGVAALVATIVGSFFLHWKASRVLIISIACLVISTLIEGFVARRKSGDKKALFRAEKTAVKITAVVPALTVAVMGFYALFGHLIWSNSFDFAGAATSFDSLARWVLEPACQDMILGLAGAGIISSLSCLKKESE